MTRQRVTWLRPWLTVRDLPLWLAIAGLLVMSATGLIGSIADPGLAPTVALVVGGCVATILAGRVLVRRIRYARPWRVTVAVLALLVLFPLLGALAFLLLPAALALLAVELVSTAPSGPPAPRGPADEAPADEAPTDEAPADEAPADFDWPDDSQA